MRTFDVTLTVTLQAETALDAVKAISDNLWYGDNELERVNFDDAMEVK